MANSEIVQLEVLDQHAFTEALVRTLIPHEFVGESAGEPLTPEEFAAIKSRVVLVVPLFLKYQEQPDAPLPIRRGADGKVRFSLYSAQYRSLVMPEEE